VLDQKMTMVVRKQRKPKEEANLGPLPGTKVHCNVTVSAINRILSALLQSLTERLSQRNVSRGDSPHLLSSSLPSQDRHDSLAQRGSFQGVYFHIWPETDRPSLTVMNVEGSAATISACFEVIQRAEEGDMLLSLGCPIRSAHDGLSGDCSFRSKWRGQ
jgi:hypothetical protein